MRERLRSLDDRTYPAVNARAATLLEVSSAFIAAIVFACCLTFEAKFIAVFAIAALWVTIQYVSLHNFGIFLDASVPILGVWIHSVLERSHCEPSSYRN